MATRFLTKTDIKALGAINEAISKLLDASITARMEGEVSPEVMELVYKSEELRKQLEETRSECEAKFYGNNQ